MSWECAVTKTQTARMDYYCEAMEWINNCGLSEEDYSADDWEKIETARSEGSKILKGQKYLNTRGKWDGEWVTFRARPEIDAICQEYDIYQDY